LGGCEKAASKENVIRVGATPVPHAELLMLIKDDLAAQGFTLRVEEFTDYVQPNMALIAGDLEANFYQSIPYFETNAEWVAKLIPAFGVHIEPFGLYSSKYKRIEDLPSGASIAIPNDPSNDGRALLLLEANGLIKLAEGVGLLATPRDIIENPRNFQFQELEAALLPRALGDVDASCINGNFALEAGLNPLKDSLVIESAIGSPYINIVAVRKGMENDPRVLALKNALLSQKVKDYIDANYNGGVSAAF
jgi:D-methionine transport system substrate-binding protein